MARLSGASANDPDSPRELVMEQVVAPWRQRDGFAAQHSAAARVSPARLPIAREGGGVPDAHAIERGVGTDLAPVAAPAREAAPRSDMIQKKSSGGRFDAQQSRIAEAGPANSIGAAPVSSRAPLQIRHRQPDDTVQSEQPYTGQSGPAYVSNLGRGNDPMLASATRRVPAATQGQSAARAGTFVAFAGEPESPDIGAVQQIRADAAPGPDRGAQVERWRADNMRQVRAPEAEHTGARSLLTPIPARGPSAAETRRALPLQSAGSGGPQVTPPTVHVGTLEVRLEAPKQRSQPPLRHPVNFRGSGILSRLYLRRE